MPTMKSSMFAGTVFDAVIAIAPCKLDSDQQSHRSGSTVRKITDPQIASSCADVEVAEGRKKRWKLERKLMFFKIALVEGSGLSGAAPTSRTFEFLEIFATISTSQIEQPTKSITMPPKKAARPAQENISLGPQVREGEMVFGVARIFASFNDTFVHVTDLSYVHP